jgi:hypothetical protein
VARAPRGNRRPHWGRNPPVDRTIIHFGCIGSAPATWLESRVKLIAGAVPIQRIELSRYPRAYGDWFPNCRMAGCYLWGVGPLFGGGMRLRLFRSKWQLRSSPGHPTSCRRNAHVHGGSPDSMAFIVPNLGIGPPILSPPNTNQMPLSRAVIRSIRRCPSRMKHCSQ